MKRASGFRGLGGTGINPRSPKDSLSGSLRLLRLWLASLALILALPVGVPATVYTWVGGTAPNWGNAAYWNPNGIPGASDDVILGASANPMTYLGTNQTVKSI